MNPFIRLFVYAFLNTFNWHIVGYYASTWLDWRRHNVFYLSIRLSVRPFVRLLHSCEHDSSKTNELILMPVVTSGPQNNGMKGQLWGSGGQKSRSHEAKVKFESLAEASFSVHLCRVAFIVCSWIHNLIIFTFRTSSIDVHRANWCCLSCALSNCLNDRSRFSIANSCGLSLKVHNCCRFIADRLWTCVIFGHEWSWKISVVKEGTPWQ